MSSIDQISAEAINRFEAAAFDPSLWLDALQGMADATGSARGQLIGIGGPAVVPFNWVTGFPEKALAEFVTIDGGNPAINPRVAAANIFPDEPVAFERHYDAVRPALKNGIYADFSATYDIPYGCQAKLLEDESGFVGLAALRTERDGRTTERDREVFARIAPHVRAAVRLQVALERQAAKLVVGAFDTMTASVFLCDGAGRVAARTPAADRLLSAGRFSLRSGHLSSRVAAETALLQKTIRRFAAVLPDEPRPPMTTLLLPGAPGDAPLVADIASLPADRWTLGAGARVLLLLRGRKRRSADMADMLAAAYGLSPAEADVALRLLNAESRDSIAAARNVSLDTVRAQIKSIFGKLDVNREVELIARLGPLIYGGGNA